MVHRTYTRTSICRFRTVKVGWLLWLPHSVWPHVHVWLHNVNKVWHPYLLRKKRHCSFTKYLHSFVFLFLSLGTTYFTVQKLSTFGLFVLKQAFSSCFTYQADPGPPPPPHPHPHLLSLHHDLVPQLFEQDGSVYSLLAFVEVAIEAFLFRQVPGELQGGKAAASAPPPPPPHLPSSRSRPTVARTWRRCLLPYVHGEGCHGPLPPLRDPGRAPRWSPRGWWNRCCCS